MYETPDCTLLDKKSIKIENVQDFQWSPEAPILSACQSEQASGNLPARVVLLKIPERTELRQKNLFSVKGALSLLPLLPGLALWFLCPSEGVCLRKGSSFLKLRLPLYMSFLEHSSVCAATRGLEVPSTAIKNMGA